MFESDSEKEEDASLPNIINPLCITGKKKIRVRLFLRERESLNEKQQSFVVIGCRNLPRPKDKSEAWTDKYALIRLADTKQQTVTRSSNPNNVQWGDTLQL